MGSVNVSIFSSQIEELTKSKLSFFFVFDFVVKELVILKFKSLFICSNALFSSFELGFAMLNSWIGRQFPHAKTQCIWVHSETEDVTETEEEEY